MSTKLASEVHVCEFCVLLYLCFMRLYVSCTLMFLCFSVFLCFCVCVFVYVAYALMFLCSVRRCVSFMRIRR